ncbi:hypothetical protein C4N15_05585 [Fusobacterium necrophorum subsp. funduliforme]|uniref:hypothetical protein n=1 Tax=Fusobacterium necrophorum TaxID=859 RepID=UPI000245E143|nr:hypothetical protein [Fusobacterium necrophorum]AVQ21139.1 hypothetical protein C4N15_05585 [Fusobacterium necrophorum subsp. funduliforme]EHO18787.1 hypothetical protein HMPREF9466_02065 [Fusobacterium necrophorum subsp. funduliforme 1_1_36S]
MIKDLKILLDNYSDLDNESKFASISDDIWQLGSLEEIKKEVSPEAFTFHIAVNMIGNWKCDGWHFIFVECNSLLPYISEVLEKLGLLEVKNQFDGIIFWLKEYFGNGGVKFLDFEQTFGEEMHYDVMNFLMNPRFQVKSEELNNISMDDRKLVSKKYKAEIEKLDDISQKLWGYGTEEDGWKNILDYIGKI